MEQWHCLVILLMQGVCFVKFQSNPDWALFTSSLHSAGRHFLTPGRRRVTLAEASHLGLICTTSARRFTYAATLPQVAIRSPRGLSARSTVTIRLCTAGAQFAAQVRTDPNVRTQAWRAHLQYTDGQDRKCKAISECTWSHPN